MMFQSQVFNFLIHKVSSKNLGSSTPALVVPVAHGEHTSQIYGSSSTGFPITPAQASNKSFSYISTSTGTGKFAWATATSSRYTGAADGISYDYDYSNVIAPVGNAQVSQMSGRYYCYRETSGSSRYSGICNEKSEYAFTGGEYIRVIHLLTGYSGTPQNANDTLYVGVY